MIRVYGFEDTPFILPRTVPNRIAYLEIVRQLDFSNVMLFSSYGKQAFMPSTLCFGDFTVLAKEGYNSILDKLLQYNMKRGPPRKDFDPEGYINSAKERINFGKYHHVPYLFDDMIRNLDEEEAEAVVESYNQGLQDTGYLSSGSEDIPACKVPQGITEKMSRQRTQKYVCPVREQSLETGDIDVRHMEYRSFVSDNEFINSPEFKSFLYKQKGKEIREGVGSITSGNEEQLLDQLRRCVDEEMANMTPEKGRKMLENAGVMIFPGLDLNSALVFDSFLKDTNTVHKLDKDKVMEVYAGSKFNTDEGSLMIWALYPSHRKSVVIDTEKAFGHVMTLKVGEVDPVVTAEIGIDIAKLNKAQIQALIREREMYKANNERLLRENDRLKDLVGVPAMPTKMLTQGESSQTKEHWVGSSAYNQGRYDAITTIVKKRQVNLTSWLNQLWGKFSSTMNAIKEHERMKERVMDKFQELTMRNEVGSTATEGANNIISRHQKFYDELLGDKNGLTEAANTVMVTLFDAKGEVKDAARWRNECGAMLKEVMKTSSAEDTSLEDVSERVEDMIRMETAIRNAVEDADTFNCQDYLDYLATTHLWLTRA